MEITPFQFGEISKAFRQVFLDKGVDKQDVEIIMEFVGSYRNEIITARTSLIDRIMRPFYRFFRKYFAKLVSKKNSWIRTGK